MAGPTFFHPGKLYIFLGTYCNWTDQLILHRAHSLPLFAFIAFFCPSDLPLAATKAVSFRFWNTQSKPTCLSDAPVPSLPCGPSSPFSSLFHRCSDPLCLFVFLFISSRANRFSFSSQLYLKQCMHPVASTSTLQYILASSWKQYSGFSSVQKPKNCPANHRFTVQWSLNPSIVCHRPLDYQVKYSRPDSISLRAPSYAPPPPFTSTFQPYLYTSRCTSFSPK